MLVYSQLSGVRAKNISALLGGFILNSANDENDVNSANDGNGVSSANYMNSKNNENSINEVNSANRE